MNEIHRLRTTRNDFDFVKVPKKNYPAKIRYLIKQLALKEVSKFIYLKKHPLLKYFSTYQWRWMLLHHVIYSSAKGSAMYSQRLSKLMHISKKTIDVTIKECLEAGYFIEMKPHKSQICKKIKNIRPSEELMIAYVNWQLSRLKKGDHTKRKYFKDFSV